MKIDMNLFCLIGALVTGITDGRISSSSSLVEVSGADGDDDSAPRKLSKSSKNVKHPQALCTLSLFADSVFMYGNQCFDDIMVTISLCDDKDDTCYISERLPLLSQEENQEDEQCFVGGLFPAKQNIRYNPSTGDCEFLYVDLTDDSCNMYTDDDGTGSLGLKARINVKTNPDVMFIQFTKNMGLSFYNFNEERVAVRSTSPENRYLRQEGETKPLLSMGPHLPRRRRRRMTDCAMDCTCAEEFRATILELEETVTNVNAEKATLVQQRALLLRQTYNTITNVNAEKATLVEQLASLRRTTDDIITDREEDVANVNAEKATLVEQLASLRRTTDDIIADREETITNVNAEKATLVEQLASLRRTTDDIIADREETITNVNAEKATLREEKDTIIAGKVKEITDLEKSIASLLTTVEDFEAIQDSTKSAETVDCYDGYERGTKLTCEEACDGQCCVNSSPDKPDSKMNDYPLDFRGGACLGFTGLVHRDGSCNGRSACQSATINEVKGPSCTGDRPCYNLKSSLVTESCNRDGSCYNSEINLMEGSCNGPEYDCNGIIATSIVSEIFDPPQESVCYDNCNYNILLQYRFRERGKLFCTDDAQWNRDINKNNYAVRLKSRLEGQFQGKKSDVAFDFAVKKIGEGPTSCWNVNCFCRKWCYFPSGRDTLLYCPNPNINDPGEYCWSHSYYDNGDWEPCTPNGFGAVWVYDTYGKVGGEGDKLCGAPCTAFSSGLSF